MTGFGSASADKPAPHAMSCTVEIRSVNNRFFKATIKLPDKLANLEPEIDRILRESLVRGSIVLSVSIKDQLSAASVQINQSVLKTYLDQIRALQSHWGPATEPLTIDLAHLLSLPGVVEAGEDSVEYLATHEEFVINLVRAAIGKLNDMRRREGAALWADLQRHVEIIRVALAKIAELAPGVVRNYHERLRARVNQLVSDARLSLSDQDLLKEVALFADRADISEEITRLGGHLDQFIHVCQKTHDHPAHDSKAPHSPVAQPPSAASDSSHVARPTSAVSGGSGGSSGTAGAGDGRKLDFIAQEMLREANTIASKANDSAIARLTVDIKSAIDRIKEQVQNAE
jgi:uncharacterized protein (TIGR00255 family)